MASQHVALAIVDEVRRELEEDRQRGGRAFATWLAGSNIAIWRIPLGSEAAATSAQLLHPNDPQKDISERASIALAASEQALVLVTHDKNALWMAIREIWRGSASSWESLRLCACCSVRVRWRIPISPTR